MHDIIDMFGTPVANAAVQTIDFHDIGDDDDSSSQSSEWLVIPAEPVPDEHESEPEVLVLNASCVLQLVQNWHDGWWNLVLSKPRLLAVRKPSGVYFNITFFEMMIANVSSRNGPWIDNLQMGPSEICAHVGCHVTLGTFNYNLLEGSGYTGFKTVYDRAREYVETQHSTYNLVVSRGQHCTPGTPDEFKCFADVAITSCEALNVFRECSRMLSRGAACGEAPRKHFHVSWWPRRRLCPFYPRHY